MLETLKRILDRLSNFDLSSWLNSITMSGYKVGLDTAQKDVGEEYSFEPDMESIIRIGIRSHALSEKAISKAKGGMAHNADKLYQEMDAAMKAGMNEKEALFQIQGRLRGLFTDSYEEWELERLARDQFLVATKEGRRAGWQKGGMKYRQWKIHSDNKTAADSGRMEGQITGIDEPYTDPLTGEKYMLAHIRPNDRCFSVGLWELPEEVIEREGLIYAKNIDTDFLKGGPGSGIRGHATQKNELKEFKKKVEEMANWQDIAEVCKKLQDSNKIVSTFIGGWYASNYLSTGLDVAVTEALNLDKGNTRKGKEERLTDSEFAIEIQGYMDKIGSEEIDVLQKIYIANQAMLKKLYPVGIIHLYRGVDGKTFEKFKDAEWDEKATVNTYNLTSWSEDEKMGEQFAKENESKNGVVLEANIPIKKIFLAYDATNKDWDKEQEMIVLGPKIDVTIGRIYENGEIRRRKIRTTLEKMVSSNVHIDEEEVNDNWLHSMRRISKGGVGSGVKGHRTWKEKTVAHKIIRDFENSIKNQSIEHGMLIEKSGKIILLKDGDKNSLRFTDTEYDRAKTFKNLIFTHNHPSGKSFSIEDIFMAAAWGFKEERAVGEKYTYIMKFGKDLPIQHLQGYYTSIFNSRYDFYREKVQGGQMTVNEAGMKHFHETWIDVAEILPGLEYKRIENKDFLKGGPGSGIRGHATAKKEKSKLYKRVEEFETKFRNRKMENGIYLDSEGNVLLAKKGTKNAIKYNFGEEIFLRAKDIAVFSHNHPNDLTFSVDDFKTSWILKIKETRAVGPKNTFILKFKKEIPKEVYDKMEHSMSSKQNSFYYKYVEEVRKGKMTSFNADIAYTEGSMEAFVNEFPEYLHYQKITNVEKGGVGSGIKGHTTQKEKQERKLKTYKMIQNFENSVRDSSIEHGWIVDEDGKSLVQKDGLKDQIEFKEEELEKVAKASFFKKMIMTHNHPEGSSFSFEDIFVCSEWGIKEVRVASEKYDYVVHLNHPNIKDVKKKFKEGRSGELYDKYAFKVLAGTMPAKEAWQQHSHEIWVNIAKEVEGITYKRIER